MGVPAVGGIGPVLSRIGQIESQIRRGVARPPVASPLSAESFTSVYQRLPVDSINASSAAVGSAVATALGASELATASVPTGSAFVAARPSTASTGASGGSVSESLVGVGIPAGTPFTAEFAAAGGRHGVPAALLAAMGWIESRYRTDAVSPDGAMGVMQIMPMTAQELGVNPWDPAQAIDGAARLLASNFSRFGSWDLAVAAYYSGAGAVSRNGNQAPPGGAAYVDRVVQRLEETAS